MKKSIFIILTALLMAFLTYHLAIADEKISPITATASSSDSSFYPPSRTVDGSLSTYWIGGRYLSYWWIMFDTGTVNQITYVNITWYSATYAPTDYDIQISSDGANWEDVFTGIQGKDNGADGEKRDINQPARYIRLYIYTVPIAYPVLREFEAYKSTAPVNQPPVADANVNLSSGVAPLTVQFTGSGSDPDGTIVSYSWNFGDGGTSNTQSPSHTYQNSGIYTATLTVTDDDGATGADSLTIAVSEPSAGGVPHLIRFQGNLADAGGLPLTGTFTLTFAIYDVETGGTSLWEEVHANIDIEKGFLDVKLGSITALNLPFDKQYWLGVQVESDSEMTPRFELTTVPYSFKSEN